MSGGSFDYLYHDMQELARAVDDIIEFCDREGAEEMADELQELRESLDKSSDTAKTVEWVASGDYGPDRLK